MASSELPPVANSGDHQPLPQPPANDIFRGPDGIRAGWRVLIFIALCALIAMLIAAGLYGFTRAKGQVGISQLTPVGIGLSEAAIFLVTAISAVVMSRIERRSFGLYGLPIRSAFGSDFWVGGLAGFLAISLCLFLIYAFHGFHLTGLAIHGSLIVSSTAAWALAFVVVGLAEEFAFRGYMQFTITTGLGFWPAAVLMSLLFGLAHAGNPGESKTGLASVVVFGLVFSLILRRTGNLWWVVGFHAGWDWGQTFFYGVPDSGVSPYHNLFNSSFHGPQWLTGGTVGPEASIFTPIVLVLAAIIFTRFYRENRYPADSKPLPAVSR